MPALRAGRRCGTCAVIHHAELTGQGLAILLCVHERVRHSVGEHDKAARVANPGEFIDAPKVRALCRGDPMTKISGRRSARSVMNNWPSEKAAVKEPR
jgi:hypothetical protein